MRNGLLRAMLGTVLGTVACHPQQTDRTELLWPDTTPQSREIARASAPRLYYFQPPAELATGTAVIVAPGGSYGHHGGHRSEGIETAKWLVEHGMTAIVVRYRVGRDGRYNHADFMADGARAVRTVRAQADELGVDPDRIGMIGFSAGGHLASMVATRCADDQGNPAASDPVERASCRLAFSVLVYPVITLDERYAHRRSRNNLLAGIPSPSPELLTALSTETQVNSTTPPTALVHSRADQKVDWHNSALFYQALVDHGVPAKLWMFDDGGHGVGLARDRRKMPQMSTWPDRLLQWLDAQQLWREVPADPMSTHASASGSKGP